MDHGEDIVLCEIGGTVGDIESLDIVSNWLSELGFPYDIAPFTDSIRTKMPETLALNDIDHTKTKVKSPQTNGICERFHKTVLQEFYQVTFRKKIYTDLESLQNDLDQWLNRYNTERTHQGKMCCGRTPMETLIDGKQIWKEKFVN